MKQGLLARLLISMVLLLLTSTCIIGYILLKDTEETVANFRLQQAHTMAEGLAQGSLDALASRDYELLQRWLTVTTPIEGFAYAYLSRADGVILTHTDIDLIATSTPLTGQLTKAVERIQRYHNRPVLEVVHPAYLGKQHLANTHLAYYLDTRSLFAEDVVLKILTVLIASLLVMSLATYLLLKQFIRPIEKLSALMESTEDSAPDIPKNILQQKDEVGLLAQRFCRLMQRLSESYNNLYNEKEFHQVTLDSIGDAVIVTDDNGDIKYMNYVAVSMTGWPADEARGHPIQEVFPIIDASTRNKIANPVEKVLQTGNVVYLSNNTTLISRDDTEYQIADSAAPIRNKDNEILGMVLVFNDVTEQYRLRQESLANQKKYQTLAAVAPVGLYYTDEQGACLYVNDKWSEITGISLQDAVGDGWARGLHPDDIERVFAAWKAAAHKGVPFRLEYRFLNEGRVRWVLGQASAEYTEDGKVNAYVGTITDITERKEAEEIMRRTQKMDALGKLTGGIAHDYNNMLGVILGYSELLEKNLDQHPKLAAYVRKIHHAGQRGADLTRKLLAFSRQKTSESRLVNINTLLQETQQMLEKTLTARIKLSLHLQDNLWPAWLDAGDLEDSVVNLCINAMHAIEGNGQINIHTENIMLSEDEASSQHMATGDYVMLSITDTGSGMDEATRERIFEPFFSTKAERGTGLGLSQVYGFVEHSGGTIVVYSEPGHGSRFVMYFPRYTENDAEEEARDSEAIKDQSGKETILVVDDEIDLLAVTCKVLTDAGYNTICVDSAKQAQHILEREPVDLLFSDVIMPEMDGYELAAMVRRQYPQIKIQLASGFTDQRNSGLVDEDLYKNILPKPYRSTELLRRIRQLLDRD